MSPDGITLNPANKRTDQCLSDFQTGIGTAAQATLDTEQLISCTRSVLVDTIASLQGSDGGMIAVSKIHEVLANVHDILDNVVYKQVGNMAHF